MLRPSSARARRTFSGSVAVAAAFVLATPGIAFAGVSATPDFTDLVSGGEVLSVAQVGDSTLIGGTFTAVGGLARDHVALIQPNGFVDPDFDPDLSDGAVVQAVAGSSDGTTAYVGGTFASVDGVERQNLVALDAATGAVRADWRADTNNVVRTMEVNADQLYVAGSFTRIDGVWAGRLVKLSTDGSVDPQFRPTPNWTIRDIAVSPDGSKVYAVGNFDTIGGAARAENAAELLTTTGAATAFDPTTGGGVALAAAISPDGGRFLFSTENNSVFAYDPAVSNHPVWVDKGGGDTQAIAVGASGEVYLGGHFSMMSGDGFKTKRTKIASVRLSDGSITAWNPVANGRMGPWAIVATDTQVLVGGDFGRIGGKYRGGFARFSGNP